LGARAAAPFFMPVSRSWHKTNATPGANPTIVSYNASAVKFYNTTSSLVRFENKTIFFYFEITL
jgi:hypothetical protein